MQHDPLSTYLNDHLAGSVVAIELLERLAEHEAANPARQQQMMELQAEIQADQDVVKRLLESRHAGQSGLKKAGAWLMEKGTHVKLRLAESENAALGEVEALEVLSLGIAGKKGLWRVLQKVLPAAEFPDAPWEELGRNADAQREKVECWRLEAACRAFQTA